ncbi:MAG: zinc chelation protein SecC [Alphaproteobacteria bacterium]|nr:zinc chelation protein SecC [Alphaproteobacteria bacterium]
MSRDPRCPCRSGRRYRRCCQPLHQGRAAPSPEALMRSRFAAYALGDVAYIVATTDPSGPQWGADEGAWRADIERFCASTRFVGLRVEESGEEEGGEGFVVFHATLEQAGPRGALQDASFGERSRFRRVDGRWRYWGGERR